MGMLVVLIVRMGVCVLLLRMYVQMTMVFCEV